MLQATHELMLEASEVHLEVNFEFELEVNLGVTLEIDRSYSSTGTPWPEGFDAWWSCGK